MLAQAYVRRTEDRLVLGRIVCRILDVLDCFAPTDLMSKQSVEARAAYLPCRSLLRSQSGPGDLSRWVSGKFLEVRRGLLDVGRGEQ